jgi:hypothetical protein
MFFQQLLPAWFTFLAVLASAIAFAGVTMQQRIKVEAGGNMYTDTHQTSRGESS